VAVVFITFALTYISPYDPVTILLQQQESSQGNISIEEQTLRIRQQYGLDDPFLVQFGRYIGNVAQGDLGISINGQRDVLRTILFSFPVSLQLGLAGALLTAVVGIGLGILAALYQNSWVDYTIVGGTLIFRSLPVFVLAPLLLVFFVLVLDVMKVPRGWDGLFNQKAILPVFILMLAPLPIVVRQTRQAILEVFAQDYVRTAKSKGLPLGMIIFRHILRNALMPVITLMGFVTEGLIVGSIFLDNIFGIPGFGGVAETAFRGFDYPMIMGITMVTALMIIVTNLVIDLLYPLLDPRIRLE
jgi:ABC-type dipeptide/oligopeptide/nickel transport system permease component